jgi:hypothetical protein
MYFEQGVPGEGALQKSIISQLKANINSQRYNASVPGATAPSTDNRYFIKRIHIYDRQNNPYRLMQSVIDNGQGGFLLGAFNKGKIRSRIVSRVGELSKPDLEQINKDIQDSQGGGNSESQANAKARLKQRYYDLSRQIYKNNENPRANLELIDLPGKEAFELTKDRKALKQFLMRGVPCLVLGTNGSLVYSANLASKTDGLQGTLNLMNALKGTPSNAAGRPAGPLEGPGGFPVMRSVPASITVSSAGIPYAQLFQTYFIDFDTGTTLDNLYSASQIQHSISPGKFTTQWTFSYTDGYGKFSAPPSLAATVTDALEGELQTQIQKLGIKGSGPK